MNTNFYETALRQALQPAITAGLICDIGDASPWFSSLMTAFPVCGSKIDWSRVPEAVERRLAAALPSEQQQLDFFDGIAERCNLHGRVIYLSDSAIDFGLAGEIGSVRQVLPTLLTLIPQHHYLIAEDLSWCMCFSMEGWLAFGYAKQRTA